MGRAGAGGGGHSGGGHSSGRTGGGHQVGGRSGGGSFGGGSSFGGRGSHGDFGCGGGFYGRSVPSPDDGFGWEKTKSHLQPPPPDRYNNSYSQVNEDVEVSKGLFTGIIVFIVAIMFIATIVSSMSDVKSTINREKLNSGVPYQNNCVVDEIGWITNPEGVEKKLQNFYKKTGVQPYVYFKSYDSTLKTNEDKEQWAQNFYTNNINNEATFLYVYFAEEDVDNDVGYMAYVNGKQVTSVMDSEAVSIFWSYIDKYWYSNMSTDDLLVTVFDETAETIMKVSTTGADIAKSAITFCIVIVVLGFIVIVISKKYKREKEKAEETERILNADMDTLVHDEADDIANKYL